MELTIPELDISELECYSQALSTTSNTALGDSVVSSKVLPKEAAAEAEQC